MISSGLTRLLAGIIIAVALPSIACFGWYSMDSVQNASTALRAMVVIAYPAALIALTLLMLAFISARRSRLQVWASALSLALSVAVVLIARM